MNENTSKTKQDVAQETREAIAVISQATREATKVLADATVEAAKVLAAAAAEALKVTNLKNSDDHDLLIKLSEQIKRLSDDVKELKNGTSKRIQDLENDKADKKEFDELKKEVYVTKEGRIRALENKTGSYTITLSLFTLAVTSLIGLVIYHILH